MPKYRTKEWAEDFVGFLTRKAEEYHICENFVEALMAHGIAHGATNVILTQEDIEALSQGKTIAYTDGEYNHFINYE